MSSACSETGERCWIGEQPVELEPCVEESWAFPRGACWLQLGPVIGDLGRSSDFLLYDWDGGQQWVNTGRCNPSLSLPVPTAGAAS